MDLTPYLRGLREELLAVAGTGDEAASALAQRLVASVASAARLAMLDVLSAAADEITRDLVPGSVEVRLRGLNPTFVVTSPMRDEELDDDSPSAQATRDQEPAAISFEGAVSRINFRPPEQLKAQIEAAANREEMSVNAWLVKVTAAAANPHAPQSRSKPRDPSQKRHFVGWIS